MEEATLRPLPPNPCSSHPCGSNALCNIVNGQAECACLANMIGSAPNCRPECVVSSDCPSNSACINQKCVDPCPGSCSANAECRAVNHSPVCSCLQGYQGDGFRDCKPIPLVGKHIFNEFHGLLTGWTIVDIFVNIFNQNFFLGLSLYGFVGFIVRTKTIPSPSRNPNPWPFI